MKTKIHPDWKKRIARIARKLWHYEADRREGRDTVEAVLRAAGHKLESPVPNMIYTHTAPARSFVRGAVDRLPAFAVSAPH